MKYKYKNQELSNKIKELLEENFLKNKQYSKIKECLLNDDDFIDSITDAIEDEFTIDDVRRMFNPSEICTIIDPDDVATYFDDDDLLNEIDNDTIARYLSSQDYDFEYSDVDSWLPIDHIMRACHLLSPRSVKTADDMKRLICDEIENSDDGKVFI